ncbi:EAL domain-containing protein [Thalassotalea sp. PS06]|uniref:EAL domain-containing protein n=1 Tax=Thalassotalea sp. PS06 TaxID=2594005 RepID=UPI001162EEED|nr:EAL domain-containing protein [Thalassotalea sp. PS06]QDP01771.1 EAL domain-containing protein [Thalassotalea sp. PS06]
MHFTNNNKMHARHVPFLQRLILFLGLCLSVVAYSEQPPLKFQQISVEQGLSQSTVMSLAQDQDGFIWMATQYGLNRYDGYEFTHFKYHSDDPFSLANNIVRNVFVDSNNVLWVGTDNGLSRYDADNNRFDNFFHEKGNANSLRDNTIWSIYEDRANNLWVSTASGLHKYNESTEDFTVINFKSYSSVVKAIKSIFQDSKGNYWLGTYENGLFVMNKDLDFVSPANGKNVWKLNIDAQSILEISELNQKIWLATENGIFAIDEDITVAAHYLPQNFTQEPGNNRVRSIHQVDDRFLWLGTEAGLLELDLVDERIYFLESAAFNTNEVTKDFIFTIFKDNSNSLWLATYYDGVSRYNSISSLFTHHLSGSYNDKKNIKAFTETPDGKIWIASESNGIYFQSVNSTIVEKLDIDLEETISSIHADANILWIITNSERLLSFNIDTSELNVHENWLQGYTEQHGRLDYIYTKGAFWFGSSASKLFKYSPQEKRLQSFSLASDKMNDLYAINVDENANIWTYTSQQEIFLFDIDKKEFQPLKLPKNNLFLDDSITVIQESADYYWFGFDDKGVAALNKATDQYTYFTEANGLASNKVAGMLIDENGKAWVSTNKGISSLNPIVQKAENFNVNQGVQADEFFSFSYLKATDNKFYFGGVNGFNSFFPYNIKLESEVVNSPRNMHLLIANERVDLQNVLNTPDQQTNNKQLYLSKDITLKYGQSPFSLEFVSPNATFSSAVKYRYKMEGIDDAWVYTDSTNKRATYTKLNPGSYEFHVQAFSSNSQEYKSSPTLTVNILPPWWLTSWAWMAYGFILVSIMLYFYRQAQQKQLVNYQIKESEERLKLALWGSGDEMWDWNIKTGQMFRSNIWGILDFPQDGQRNKQGASNKGNIHPQDSNRVNQALDDHFMEKTDHFEAAYRVKNNQGKWTWVLDRGKVVERDINNAPSRMTGTIKDISKIKQTEESLKLFAKCIANISDAVVVYDEDFNTVDCNPSFQRITGQTRSEAIGSPLEFKSYPHSFLQNLKKNLIHHGSWQGEIESKRLNGQRYLVDITMDVIRDENQKITHYVGVFSDITKRKETEKELRKLANTDTLTGLPNRSYFQTNHTILVNQDTVHALLVFDLDNFKKINDSLGHQIGDVLLCKVTERIATVGNLKDTCYRLGGDEFSLIIEGTNDLHEITTIADEILKAVAEPYNIRNQEIALSCSIGIALFPEDGKNSHELLKNADTAMYHAKDKGGDCYQFFNDSMNTQAVKRLQVENLIRHGLKEDLFSVFYQPKINITTGKVSGMEALVRFEAGAKGIIRPDIFIPISEETGQIIEIGENVLRKACHATKVWVDKGIFNGRIAVNLSAVQFRQPNLVKMIESILAETRLPAQYLELEITEGTVMNSPQEAIDTMHRLRSMGISLSLDDFGTGYSSLAYLKKFPLNTLKIDKAFVDDIEASEQGKNMVATIITIAHNLGLDVVAEGVENQNQLDYLKSKQCEQLQGYLYSKPLSEEDFSRYLLSHIITRESTPYSTE